MPVGLVGRGCLSANTGLPPSPHSFLGDHMTVTWPCKLVPERGGHVGSRVLFFHKDPKEYFIKSCFTVNIVYLQWAGPCLGHFLPPVEGQGTYTFLTPFPF